MSNPKVKVTLELEVPQDWIDFVTQGSDVFRRDHCGYWAQVQKWSDKGAIVRVDEDGELGEQRTWDRAFACKAYAEGVKRKGVDFYEQGDANDYDCAIQMAWFGEVVYG
jgi:hypothetical protein